jgi:hypothetical protein
VACIFKHGDPANNVSQTCNQPVNMQTMADHVLFRGFLGSARGSLVEMLRQKANVQIVAQSFSKSWSLEIALGRPCRLSADTRSLPRMLPSSYSCTLSKSVPLSPY